MIYNLFSNTSACQRKLNSFDDQHKGREAAQICYNMPGVVNNSTTKYYMVVFGIYGLVWQGIYRMAWHGMVWYGMVWYGMVWYGIVWYGMVWHEMVWLVWYGMVWYGMVWYGMVWYGMVWYGMVCMVRHDVT